jgi:hypothetical protein
MPRLGRPTRRGTWSDLKSTLLGGGVDRLTGAVGRTWQLVAAHLSKDCWEIGHSAEVLDSSDRECVKLWRWGSRVLQPMRPSILSYFRSMMCKDYSGPQRVVGGCNNCYAYHCVKVMKGRHSHFPSL